MNCFKLNTVCISLEKILVIDGIEFTNSILIDLAIDNLSARKFAHLDVALVVFPELLRSLTGSGRYLIFTSASGIADEGGLEGVDVKVDKSFVVWNFEIEDVRYEFKFDFVEYQREIRKIEQELKLLTTRFTLEPSGVFFPESWDK